MLNAISRMLKVKQLLGVFQNCSNQVTKKLADGICATNNLIFQQERY